MSGLREEEAASEEAIVRLSGVGVRYRLAPEGGRSFKAALRALLRPRPREDYWALRGLDLELSEGTVLGVLGRNGAGKSTLCRLVAGIIAPDEGRIEVRGRVTSLLGVGIGFNEELTGRDNIDLSGAFFGFSRSEMQARFDEIAAFADIGRFMDVPLKAWSEGMKTRLGFSIGAHTSGEVLILDEVLGVGDAGFQARCRARIAELMGQAKAILIVSHNGAQLASMATELLWLDGGQARQRGEPAAVLAAYEAAVGAS